MNGKGAKILNILLAISLLCGGVFGQPALAQAAEWDKTPAEAAQITAVAAIPEYQWQKKASFPDWKGYTDDTLAMNSMLSFQF